MNKNQLTENSSIFPFIDKDLLDRLNILYPEESPKLTMGISEIWFKSGQRDVIKTLNYLFQKQRTGKT